ncbi:MAG: STAS domain-containing protein [Acidimicrobiia bacterium]|jgi:anti-anti-sigma factor
MPGTAFKASLRSVDGIAVVDMSGDVNRGAQPELDEIYARAEAMGGSIVLDFTDVDYINSTGIAVIVGILAKARAAGRPIRAYGLSEHYREIFSITRISDFMAIYDNESAAVAAG